jgi:hypothetical protein
MRKAWFALNWKNKLPPDTEGIVAIAAATLYTMNFYYESGVVLEIPDIYPDVGIKIGGFALPVERLDCNKVSNTPIAAAD